MAKQTAATSTSDVCEESKKEKALREFSEFISKLDEEKIIPLSEFTNKCNSYFSYMTEKKKEFPDIFGLIRFLGIDEPTYRKYEELPGYSDVCKDHMSRRASILLRSTASNNRASSTGTKMLLAMKDNGGLVEGDSGMARGLKITLNGFPIEEFLEKNK